MPALGMAQDEGVIVAWLKQPGEAVAEGEALMEVETDKATMEVEAQVAGFLQDVRAKAGEAVPVGQAVAIISDTAEVSAAHEAATGAPANPVALPDGHRVIMPALGMAQDSGQILAWQKSPGDAVKAGEVLVDVETDKAAVEVEAGCDGYLAAVLADTGEDVPVGQVIAVVSAVAPEAPVRRSRSGKAGEGARVSVAASAPSSAEPIPAPPAEPAAGASPGRVLASPKARRLAAEQGLDLAALAAAGAQQPFHVADLERLRTGFAAAAAPVSEPAAEPLEWTAEAPAEALDAFVAWYRKDREVPLDTAHLLAAFAAGALRSAADPSAHIAVRIGDASDGILLVDPDLPPVATAGQGGDHAATLILHDLTFTRITRVQRRSGQPEMTVTRRGEVMSLTLRHLESAMDSATGAALITGLADRIADPLRQLL